MRRGSRLGSECECVYLVCIWSAWCVMGLGMKMPRVEFLVEWLRAVKRPRPIQVTRL